MARLAQTDGLTDIQQDMLSAVRTFVDKEVLPVATGYEHRDEFPDELVGQMKEMGLFGITIDERYGGLGESLLTYALVVEEMARGWMSLAGVLNTHFIVAYLVSRHGTDAQRERLLPRMATGELRAAFSLSEPGCGSDVAAIGTRAVRDGDDYVVNGQKMWLTNGLRAGLVATLVKTDEGADSVYRNMTTLLIEKEPGASEHGGITIPRQLEKMGYKGVETTELVFTDHRVPADMALGERPGAGFSQMMDGLEVGRVNVAARACGIAIRAFELAIGYAQQRQAFGHPISDHQAVAFKLAEMATKVEAAHLMMVRAARLKDAGERNDLEAGMAKLLASEYCVEVTTDAFRIHGGYGYSKEFEIERLYREAPFLLIGEGTSEIQKRVISRQLLKDYRL